MHHVCRIEVRSCQWLLWVARARDQNPDRMYCLWDRCQYREEVDDSRRDIPKSS